MYLLQGGVIRPTEEHWLGTHIPAYIDIENFELIKSAEEGNG
jgi:hypothetical protein